MKVYKNIFRVGDKWHGELLEICEETNQLGRFTIVITSSWLLCWLKIEWRHFMWEYRNANFDA